MTHRLDTSTLIVGGGPGGLAPLLAASHSTLLGQLLGQGLTIVDRGHAIGQGDIGRYAINSDSSAETFLSCVADSQHGRLAAVADHPAARAIAPYGKGAVPLQMAGFFLAEVGRALRAEVDAAPGGQVVTRHQALWTRRETDGAWTTRLRRLATGDTTDVRSRNVVLATGGEQPIARLRRERVAGVRLLPRYAHSLIQSGEALTPEGLLDIGARLSRSVRPRIVVIGGSTSALATVHALLHRLSGIALPDGAVTILHRKPLRVFYPSAEAARAEGYDEFGEDDICPVSKFVYRFGGFRFDSRELVMQLRGLGGRGAEPRVRLHRLQGESDPAAQRLLDEADIIIACLGYRPKALPVYSADGVRIPLLADLPGSAPLVGPNSGVLDADGHELPGLMGIGLASGFSPKGKLGGEASFRGQSNGLWLWQHDIGRGIAETACARGPLPGRVFQLPVRPKPIAALPSTSLSSAPPPLWNTSVPSVSVLEKTACPPT